VCNRACHLYHDLDNVNSLGGVTEHSCSIARTCALFSGDAAFETCQRLYPD
jgi:hypothetical protein